MSNRKQTYTLDLPEKEFNRLIKSHFKVNMDRLARDEAARLARKAISKIRKDEDFLKKAEEAAKKSILKKIQSVAVKSRIETWW